MVTLSLELWIFYYSNVTVICVTLFRIGGLLVLATTFNDSIKGIKTWKKYIKMQFLSAFSNIVKVATFLVKKLYQWSLRGVSNDLYTFWVFSIECLTVPSFIIVGYV